MPRPSRSELLRKLRIQSQEWMPLTPETVINPLNEPSSTLPMLDADFVHSAISSAEKGDTRNFFALARDAVSADTDLLGLISTRLIAVLGDEPAILPANPKKPEDKLAADVIRDADAVDRLVKKASLLFLYFLLGRRGLPALDLPNRP